MTPYFELRKLESGYWHFRLSREVWAQWLGDRAPEKEDCFNPEWTWDAIRAAWLAR